MKQEQLIVLAVFAVVLLGISGMLPLDIWGVSSTITQLDAAGCNEVYATYGAGNHPSEDYLVIVAWKDTTPASGFSTLTHGTAYDYGAVGECANYPGVYYTTITGLGQESSLTPIGVERTTFGYGNTIAWASKLGTFTGLGAHSLALSTSTSLVDINTVAPSGMPMPERIERIEAICGQASLGTSNLKYLTCTQTTTSPTCDDGLCNGGETLSTCPADCPAIGNCADGTLNGFCSTVTIGKRCVDGAYISSTLCGAAQPTCGDGVCNGGESVSSCPADCHVTMYCGDGTCNNGETTLTCIADCPSGVCSDGTANGACSSVSVGLKCTNGVLASDAVCNVTPPPTPTIWQMIQNFITWLLHLFGVG